MRDLNIIDYTLSKYLQQIPFDALVAAAMRKADTENLNLLGEIFPQIRKDLHDRYNAPGGYLERDAKVNSDQMESIVKNYLKTINS